MDTNLPISQLDPIGAQEWTGVGDLHTAYLGPMPTLQRIDPYQKRNISIYDLPEAYKNQSYNPYVGETIEDAAFTMNQEYIQTRILPLFQTDDLNFQWEKFENNAHLMEITPYQTMAHKVTSRRTVRRAQLVRFGIEAEFENDFLATAMGRIRWLATLGQFARSYAETMRAEGIRALCTGHRYQQEFVRQAGMPEHQELAYYLKQDLERFGIAQKTKNGLEKLNEQINKEMSSYGGQANAFIVPEEIAIFTDLVRSEKTDYYLAGPLGPARVNNLPEARNPAAGGTLGSLTTVEPKRWVQDVPVYIVKNLRVENVSARDSEYLRRDRQIGEFVTNFDDGYDYSDYESKHRSFLMYDMDIDDMRKIDLEACVEHCGLFDREGRVRPIGYSQSDSTIRRQDKDEDFLTVLRPNGTREVADYLFDIAPEYLNARCALNGGQSLAAQFIRQYGDVGRRALAYIPRPNAENLIVYPGDNTEDGIALTHLGTFLTQVLGEDSLFGDYASKIRSGGPGKAFYDFFLVNNAAEVVRRSQTGETRVASQIDEALYKTLLAKVPQSKKAEIQTLIQTSPGSAVDKAYQIRGKIYEYLEAKVPGLDFQEKANVDEWYERRIENYRSKVGQEPVAGQVVGFMPLGLDLSGTPYRYLYSASAHRRNVPQGIERFRPFAAQIDAVNSGIGDGEAIASSRMVESGAMGLAGIGQFDRDPGPAAEQRTVDLSRMSTFVAHEQGVNSSGATNVVKNLSYAFLTMRITQQNLLGLVRNNIALPMGFLLCSPHQQFATRGIIKCMQDGGTGITAVGHSSTATSSAVGTRVTRLNFRTHMRAIILYPENLYVQPDIFVQEYQGGGGCRFYSPETYRGMNPEEHLQNSLICIALPCTEKNIPSPMHMTGRFATPYNVALSVRSTYERLHYSTAARYNALYDFLGLARDGGGSESTVLIPGLHHHNLVCYQGHQQNYNPKSGEYNKIIVCKGHKTKNVYAGCKKIWDGGLEELEIQDYATKNAQ